ncbi:hypothetical protein M0805_005488 [Coniferiporia weirii]|nr:hypothetical protein M0805_005488 [Coniferiporia weirii]
MKLILTGATGAAGLEILRTAIADSGISKITVLSRRALPPSVPPSDKVTFIQHTDFTSYSPDLLEKLKGYGACVWALGVSQRGMQEDVYTRITYDYPVSTLKALGEAGVRGEDGKMRFVFVSGEGADPSEKSRFLFGRVKGRAEKDLAGYAASSSSGLEVVVMRPGYFFPSNPIDAATIRGRGARMLDSVAGSFYRTLVPSLSIKIADLAQFAVEAAKGRIPEGTFNNMKMKETLMA